MCFVFMQKMSMSLSKKNMFFCSGYVSDGKIIPKRTLGGHLYYLHIGLILRTYSRKKGDKY